MRARGLKLPLAYGHFRSVQVAPHAGAWIETHYIDYLSGTRHVAPHAGAWIETI